MANEPISSRVLVIAFGLIMQFQQSAHAERELQKVNLTPVRQSTKTFDDRRSTDYFTARIRLRATVRGPVAELNRAPAVIRQNIQKYDGEAKVEAVTTFRDRVHNLFLFARDPAKKQGTILVTGPNSNVQGPVAVRVAAETLRLPSQYSKTQQVERAVARKATDAYLRLKVKLLTAAVRWQQRNGTKEKP